MEKVDVLTSKGQPTGRTVFRCTAHSKGLWHRSVHIWIKNRKGELLLQQRSLTKQTHPGLWDISAAGHISAGDSSRSTAIREIWEELGISIDNNALRFLFTLRRQYRSPDNMIKDNEISDVYLYTVPVDEAEIKPNPEEVIGVAYYPINQLKNILIEEANLFVPHEEEYRRLFEVIASLT